MYSDIRLEFIPIKSTGKDSQIKPFSMVTAPQTIWKQSESDQMELIELTNINKYMTTINPKLRAYKIRSGATL